MSKMIRPIELNSRWMTLEKFYQEKRFSYLDFMVALNILKHTSQMNEGTFFFLCYLVAASRQGHLCVQIDEQGIIPSPKLVWKPDEENPLMREEIDFVDQMMIRAVCEIPKEIITEVKGDESQTTPTTPLCQFQSRYYLQRNWVYESLFLKHLNRLSTSCIEYLLDRTSVEMSVNELLEKKILLSEQAQAVINSCLSPFSILTGGPGTGKTYTAAHLIKVYWQSLTEVQRKRCEIVLAAPTGKAAANLQHGLTKMIAGLKDFPSLKAKTLHSLLGLNSSFIKPEAHISADLIIVDECSMMDIKMISHLFAAVKDGARLVLLGDPNQLPSVEAGSLFSDIVELHRRGNISIPCIELKTCLRAELTTIVELAAMVNDGKQEVSVILKEGTMAGISQFPLGNEKKRSQKLFLDKVVKLFPDVNVDESDPVEILKAFQGVRLLSPIKKGLFGFETLNQMIGEAIVKKANQQQIAIPIMVVANDYKRELFNGDMGVLIKRISSSREDDYALFYDPLGGGVRRIAVELLPRYEYGYCLSIHKSQGSECDHVVLVMPEGAEIFGRELFYTAVTRAKRQVDIYGSDEVIKASLQQQSRRLSGVSLRVSYNNIHI